MVWLRLIKWPLFIIILVSQSVSADPLPEWVNVLTQRHLNHVNLIWIQDQVEQREAVKVMAENFEPRKMTSVEMAREARGGWNYCEEVIQNTPRCWISVEDVFKDENRRIDAEIMAESMNDSQSTVLLKSAQLWAWDHEPQFSFKYWLGKTHFELAHEFSHVLIKTWSRQSNADIKKNRQAHEMMADIIALNLMHRYDQDIKPDRIVQIRQKLSDLQYENSLNFIRAGFWVDPLNKNYQIMAPMKKFIVQYPLFLEMDEVELWKVLDQFWSEEQQKLQKKK